MIGVIVPYLQVMGNYHVFLCLFENHWSSHYQIGYYFSVIGE